jgi:Family of unknown function (DUF6386)
MSSSNIAFTTDTATICVFDVARLKHRLTDDADWWSVPVAELAELNSGNAAFFGLGQDGTYQVRVVGALSEPAVTVNLQVPSGRVFVGAGEEVTSDGLEPECICGGAFVETGIGNFAVSAKRDGGTIYLCFERTEATTNTYRDLLRLM